MICSGCKPKKKTKNKAIKFPAWPESLMALPPHIQLDICKLIGSVVRAHDRARTKRCSVKKGSTNE